MKREHRFQPLLVFVGLITFPSARRCYYYCCCCCFLQVFFIHSIIREVDVGSGVEMGIEFESSAPRYSPPNAMCMCTCREREKEKPPCWRCRTRIANCIGECFLLLLPFYFEKKVDYPEVGSEFSAAVPKWC